MSTRLQQQRKRAANARSKRKGGKQNRPQPQEAICPEKVYPVRLIPTLLGIGRWTIRQAERDGMPVGGLGTAKFVRGSDLAKHIFKDS